MPPKNDGTVKIENAQIIFRNFKGEETPFNKAGDRNFGVLLPDEIASQMQEDGWNVKYLKPREEDEEQVERPWLPVAVRFDVFPAHITTISSKGRTTLNEGLVEMLDWADIKNVDLIVRPYFWEVGSKSGIKAYVKTMFVIIEIDELQEKYAETQTS